MTSPEMASDCVVTGVQSRRRERLTPRHWHSRKTAKSRPETTQDQSKASLMMYLGA